MGAAGLTSSAAEMGAKGDLGIDLDLDHVPCRETGMSAYEMMLSESQERMLMVLKPEKEPEAEAIFRKWGLDFAVIGKTTDTRRFVIRRAGEIKADLPIKELGDQAPLYDRPWTKTGRAPVLDATAIAPPMPTDAALIKLLSSPDLCSKRWIFEQYDTLILGNTVQGPGGDAAVVRLGEGPKGLALTTDCTERYCAADPREGGKQAVAEAWRNLIAVGARPLALTDNLNFGNPERPEAMGELVGCIEGIGEAARALDFPVVSGNVSLYNETMGAGIPPTPAIGGVGLIEDVAKTASLAFKAAGEDIWLVGGAPGWLGQSAWLATVAGREEGAPPPVDLATERRNGEFVASVIRGGRVSAVHDLSDGGLAVALAEMAMAGGIGAERRGAGPLEHAFFFGEDQGRYVLTAPPAESAAIADEAKRLGVSLARIGVTGGQTLKLGGAAPVALAALSKAYESWLPDYHEPSLWGQIHDPVHHRQNRQRLRLHSAGARGRHQCVGCGRLPNPHDRRGHDRCLRARRGCRGAARDGGPRRRRRGGSDQGA